MTIPDLASLVKQAPRQDTIPDIGALVSKEPEQPPNRFAERLNMLWKFATMTFDNDDPETAQFFDALSRRVPVTYARHGEALKKLGISFAKWIDPVANIKDMAKLARDPESSVSYQTVKAIKDTPVKDLFGGLVSGIVDLGLAPLEAELGITVRDSQWTPLTEQERVDVDLQAAGGILGVITGAKSGVALQEILGKQAIKRVTGTKFGSEALRMGEKVADGAMKRAMIKGVTEGAIGGTAYGLIAGAEDPDVVDKALVTGLMFAPLGAAHERLRIVGKASDLIGKNAQKVAGEMAQLRTLQATSEDTFYGLLKTELGIETAADLADAVLRSKLDFAEPSFVVPGITSDQIPRLIHTIASGESKITPQFRERPDGLFDMAIIRAQSPEWLAATMANNAPAAILHGAPEPRVKYWDPTDPANGGTQIGPQEGTNPGGMYDLPVRGPMYVKKLPPEQAWNEAIANRLYRDLGVPVTEQSHIFSGPQNDMFIGNELITNKGTLGELGLENDKATASRIVKDMAVDAFLGNWDAVGLNHDNIVITPEGTPVRVDQGGALLYRARGGLKPAEALTSLNEINTLKDPKLNPSYAKLVETVGTKQANKMLEDGLNRIVRYAEAVESRGGWEQYLEGIFPAAPGEVIVKVADMLKARTNELIKLQAAKKGVDVKKLAVKFKERESKLFDQTGFLFNEIVSYNGVDYVITDLTRKKGIVEGYRYGQARNTVIELPVKEIRHNPDQIKILFHGTTRVYGDYDPAFFQNRDEGKGVFLAERAKLASDYYAMGGDDNWTSAKDMVDSYTADIAELEKHIAELEVKPERNGYDQLELSGSKQRLKDLKIQLADEQARLDDFLQQHTPNIRIANVSLKNELDLSGDRKRLVRKEDIARVKAQAAREGIDSSELDYPDINLEQFMSFLRYKAGGGGSMPGRSSSYGPAMSAFLERAGYIGFKREHMGGAHNDIEHIIFNPKNIRPGFDIPEQKYGAQPENFGRALYDDFNNTVPDWSEKGFNKALQEFAEKRGIPRQELPAYEDVLTREFEKDVAAYDPDVKRIFDERDRTVRQEVESELLLDQAELVRRANTNGVTIDVEDAGYLTLRDFTGYKLGKFKNNEEALAFLNLIGQARDGPILSGDGGTGLPPRFGAGILPPSDGHQRPHQAPYAMNSKNFGEGISDWININTAWATQPLTVMDAIDSRFGTQLRARIGDPGIRAVLRFNAAIREPMEKLDKILGHVRKVTSDRREAIGSFMETLRPVEDATPTESAVAAQLVRSKKDITQIMRYNKAVTRVINSDADNNMKSALIRKLQDEHHLDADALRMAELLQGSNARMGIVAKLTREAERAGGIGIKVTAAEEKAARELFEFQKELGPEAESTNDILTHARLYTDGDLNAAAADFGLTQSQREFFQRAFGMGDIDAYQHDPFIATMRFIRAREKAATMSQTLKDITIAAKEELAKVGDAKEDIQALTNRFIGDIQGNPSASRKALQEMIERVNKARGWNLDKDVIHKTVTAILQTGDAATQGGRVLYAGLRDFVQPVILYEARFGHRATGKMLDYGAKGYEGVTALELEKAGELAHYDITTIAQADEFTNSLSGRAVSKGMATVNDVNKFFFRMSGQAAAYRRIASGIYLERWDTGSRELLKLTRGETTKAKAYKALKLETYKRSTVAEFDRLVTGGKMEEATRMLARATVEENAGLFAQGNRLPWSRLEVTRLAGQFGQWSRWFVSHLQQMATRGTKMDRAAYFGKMAAVQAAFMAAGAAVGINVRPWQLGPAVAFMGGPSAEMARTVMQALGGSGVEGELARYRLSRFMPIQDGQLAMPNVWYPGKFLLTDFAQAYEMAEQDDPRALLRAMGYRPDDR